MAFMVRTLLRTLSTLLATHGHLTLEILVWRQQFSVLPRSVKRPYLEKADLLFWVLLSSVWADWATTLTLVKPETVIRWHRKGFRLYWTWKSRRNRKGRSAVAWDVRDRIRKMSRANPPFSPTFCCHR